MYIRIVYCVCESSVFDVNCFIGKVFNVFVYSAYLNPYSYVFNVKYVRI